MNFGIQTGQQHRSYNELLALWRLAEEAGYDCAWLFDHLVPVGGDPNGPLFEAWTLLSSLLSRTERIRGGVLVSCVMYREPAVLAKQAATIDHASGGRLEFGIGSCWNAWEAGQYGLEFPPFRQRHERLLEAIDIARAVWGAQASAPGEHYAVSAEFTSPRPLQDPHPPIWVGGTGASVGEACVKADGWNAIFTTLDEYRAHLERVRGELARAGRDPDTLRLSFGQRVMVDRDAAKAEARARAQYERHNIPFDDHIRDRYFFGTAEHVAEQIAGFRDLGVEQFIAWHEPPFDDDAEEQIRVLAEDVMPLLG